ncbi:hypothetical protein ARMSODRAFT_1006705 [Armillaria solidipes]|uniref:Uncharacterized protein n=1 Tax=Armillaria solidipes TaxID=1076256 RepID=A0A2H3B3B0_9AGAR|nr:hypothetical protein ARMSODRAFT_1006705 [Armillaria solidipes]
MRLLDGEECNVLSSSSSMACPKHSKGTQAGTNVHVPCPTLKFRPSWGRLHSVLTITLLYLTSDSTYSCRCDSDDLSEHAATRSSTHTHPAPSLGRCWLLPALPPMASRDLAAMYHPDFDTPGTDALLSSLDGTLFCLPSGALDIVRASITVPAFVRERLQMYALATRFVWEEEAEFASKHMLGLSLHGSSIRRRCKGVVTQSTGQRFSVDGAWIEDVLGNGGEAVGDGLSSSEIEEWLEMDVCWPEKCPGCRRLAYAT